MRLIIHHFFFVFLLFFVFLTAVSLAMSRDGSSGGVIRTVVIDKDGIHREMVPFDKLPRLAGLFPTSHIYIFSNDIFIYVYNHFLICNSGVNVEF